MVKDILDLIGEKGQFSSFDFAAASNQDHQAVVGVLKSLERSEHVALEQKSQERWVLTVEGEDFATNGTIEYRIFQDVGKDGAPRADIEKKYPEQFKFGFGQCAKRKWLSLDKASDRIVRLTQDAVDSDGRLLVSLKEGLELSAADLKSLQGRKLIEKKVINYFIASKGKNFGQELVEEHADITAEMIRQNKFDQLTFKSFNLNSLGMNISTGSLHPLMKTRSTFREILLELG